MQGNCDGSRGEKPPHPPTPSLCQRKSFTLQEKQGVWGLEPKSRDSPDRADGCLVMKCLMGRERNDDRSEWNLWEISLFVACLFGLFFVFLWRMSQWPEGSNVPCGYRERYREDIWSFVQPLFYNHFQIYFYQPAVDAVGSQRRMSSFTFVHDIIPTTNNLAAFVDVAFKLMSFLKM